MRLQTASTLRSSALRSKVLSFEKTCSIGRVGWQEQQTRTCASDQLPDLAALVGAEVVHDNDIARLERRDEDLLDIDCEGIAVDRPVKHERCRDAVMPQASEECHRLPMAVRNFSNKGFSTCLPAARARHVGLGPCFVNEDQTRWINPALILFPANAAARHVWPVLLDGEQGFF